jgi:hypothetical protein
MRYSLITLLLSLHGFSANAFLSLSPPAVAVSGESSFLLRGENVGSHSFVEGQDFSDRMAELEAMGGDPFFLSDGDDDDQQSSTGKDNDIEAPSSTLMSSAAGGVPNVVDALEDRYVTDGKGPMPNTRKEEPRGDGWEWDGIVDENAHMDW